MCGLIGFSGPGKYDVNKIKMLMLLNAKRGTDSAGFYTLTEDRKNYFLPKEVGPVYDDLIYNKAFDKGYRIFIGHCRKSSYGAKTKDNAHPFEDTTNKSRRIILAHNGTLTDVYDFKRYLEEKHETFKDKFGASLDVDSKIFARYFNLTGIDDPGVLSLYRGAAALLYTDTTQNNNVLYAYTDGERPLHYGYCEEGIYISSEQEPLLEIGCTKVKEFEKNIVYRIKEGEFEKAKITVKKNPFPIKTYTYENDYVHHGYGGRSSRMLPAAQQSGFVTNTAKKPEPISITVEELYEEFKNDENYNKDFYNPKTKVSLKAARLLFKNGEIKFSSQTHSEENICFNNHSILINSLFSDEENSLKFEGNIILNDNCIVSKSANKTGYQFFTKIPDTVTEGIKTRFREKSEKEKDKKLKAFNIESKFETLLGIIQICLKDKHVRKFSHFHANLIYNLGLLEGFDYSDFDNHMYYSSVLSDLRFGILLELSKTNFKSESAKKLSSISKLCCEISIDLTTKILQEEISKQ